MTGYLLEALQLALTLALAPGLVGLVRWLKARLQNRRGAPPWQPYFELRKLFGKEVVMSRNASWLFRLALYLIFASSAAVALFAPVLVTPLPFDWGGDLLVVVYLLLLGTFFLALAGCTGARSKTPRSPTGRRSPLPCSRTSCPISGCATRASTRRMRGGTTCSGSVRRPEEA